MYKADKSRWVILLAVLLIPLACGDRNEPDIAGTGELQVRLLIDTQSSVSTRAGTDDVSAIQQLRVYVFNSEGERIGYYYNGNLEASGNAYYVPMQLREGGTLDFYVLANESSADIEGLDENTALEALEAIIFNAADIDTSKGCLMSYHTQREITDVTGVTIVECPLVRDVSLVDVYFAKSGNFDAAVTGVSLADYTTSDEVRWGKDIVSAEPRAFGTAPVALLNGTTPVAVTAVVPEEQQTAPAGYGTAVISHPVTSNPCGSAGWSTAPDTDKKPRLHVGYTVGSAAKTATVYLPVIGNNYRCNVYCLIMASGVEFLLNVLPWDYEGKEIIWSKQYEFEFTVGRKAVESGEDKYIEIKHTDTTDPQDANDVLITFKMTGPAGTPWKASLDNGQDFYFYNEDDKADYNYVPQGVAVKDAAPVTIRLKTRNRFEEARPKATRFAIRVQSPDQTEGWIRLPINQAAITSGEEDVIWIKQVPNQ